MINGQQIDALRESLTPPNLQLMYPGYDYTIVGQSFNDTNRTVGLSGLVPASSVMIFPRNRIEDPDCAFHMDISTVLGEQATPDYDVFALKALLGKSRPAATMHPAREPESLGRALSLSELVELKLPVALMTGWARSKKLYEPTEIVTVTYNRGAGLYPTLNTARAYIKGALTAIERNSDSYALRTLDTTDFDRAIGLTTTTVNPQIDTTIVISRAGFADTVDI